MATALGAKLFVSSVAPATRDQAGYEALTWTEVKSLQNIGEIGSTHNEVTYPVLGERITKFEKGSRTAGGISPVMNTGFDDAGQEIIRSAVDGALEDTEIQFKIELKGGVSLYNAGYVSAAPLAVGGPDDPLTEAVEVKFNYDKVLVKP